MPGGAYENWDAPRQVGAVGCVHNPVVERRQPEYHLSDRDDIHVDEMAAREGGGSPWGNKHLAQRVRTNGDHTAWYGNRGEATARTSTRCYVGTWTRRAAALYTQNGYELPTLFYVRHDTSSYSPGTRSHDTAVPISPCHTRQS